MSSQYDLPAEQAPLATAEREQRPSAGFGFAEDDNAVHVTSAVIENDKNDRQ